MIFFHGNAEDLGISYEMLDHLRQSLKLNILAVEYPGYGIYNSQTLGSTTSSLTSSFVPSEPKILSDAESVLNFALTFTSLTNIILLGRSLGTGPATYLASKYSSRTSPSSQQQMIAALILMSPFTSMRSVATDKVGSLMSLIVPECFNNLERIKDVYCPTFILHGQKDSLIPLAQA